MSGAAEALVDTGNGGAVYLALKTKYASTSRAALMDFNARNHNATPLPRFPITPPDGLLLVWTVFLQVPYLVAGVTREFLVAHGFGRLSSLAQ